MKIRNGFVSNSSSSSFVIKMNDLTQWQIDMIKDYFFSGQLFGMNLPEIDREDYERLQIMDYFNDNTTDADREKINNIFCYINWEIHEEVDDEGDLCLTGFTIIDNFDMYELFEKMKIDSTKIKWEHSG